MTNTVLVTGGGGFIGTWVLHELQTRGLPTVVFDIERNSERWQRVLGDAASGIHYVAGNLLDRERLRRTAAEYHVSHIIHLATLLTPACQQDPYAGCEVNVLGSVALFELARELAGQIQGISYASSYAVYGPEVDDGTTIKTNDNRPPSFYGAFKLAVDLIAEQYWRHFQIRSAGIRPHVVYGPERTLGLTAAPSLAVRAAVNGESFAINYTGRLGYDFVRDVARAFVRTSLETPPGATVVDLPGEIATSEEFVRAIVEVIPAAKNLLSVNGPAIPANIPPQPKYINELFSDWRERRSLKAFDRLRSSIKTQLNVESF